MTFKENALNNLRQILVVLPTIIGLLVGNLIYHYFIAKEPDYTAMSHEMTLMFLAALFVAWRVGDHYEFLIRKMQREQQPPQVEEPVVKEGPAE